MLIIDSLEKRLGRREVLRGACLRIDEPSVVCIRGPNGSGKSTLVRCVAGVWRPDAGDVLVDGASTIRDPRARARIGYVPDSFSPFPELTVGEMLGLVAALKRVPRPSRALLERLGVDDFEHRLMSQLSAGQRRRAALVAGLVSDTWLLVLDEPTSGLDVDGVAMLADLLRERTAAGQATLMVTHEPAFASTVDARYADLIEGRLEMRHADTSVA